MLEARWMVKEGPVLWAILRGHRSGFSGGRMGSDYQSGER